MSTTEDKPSIVTYDQAHAARNKVERIILPYDKGATVWVLPEPRRNGSFYLDVQFTGEFPDGLKLPCDVDGVSVVYRSVNAPHVDPFPSDTPANRAKLGLWAAILALFSGNRSSGVK